jgi:acetyltransferase-like isoleucine patch superfamily enzyme
MLLWFKYPKNTIHPSFKYGKGLRMDNYNVIEKNVIVGKDCFIGNHNMIRPDVVMGDRADIRAFCHLAEGAVLGNDVLALQYSNIAKGTIIEDKVFIGAKTLMINTRKISKWRDYPFVYKGPYIEYGVRIGSGSLICPGVRIAHNCMIQAGSLVTKSTEPYGIYRGRPAVRIDDVPEEERI